MLSGTRDWGRWLPLARRSPRLEWLDAGLVTGDELRTNLADLARLNRLPGGGAASADAVGALLDGASEATVLDVGTGAGDLPLTFAARGWAVVGLDADPAVVAEARARTAHVPAIRIVEGDARDLPLDDASVDVVHASLLAHHLDPPAALRAFAEMARVARLGVVVNDLRRGLLPLLAAGVCVAALGRCRTTRHDGLLSVRRAYTPTELDGLLATAGLRVTRRTAGWMPRVVTTAVPQVAP
jgi:SAM-dependent methyltransferase